MQKQFENNEKYKTISLWMDSEMILKIEEFARKTNRSKDEIINLFIEYGLDNYKRE